MSALVELEGLSKDDYDIKSGIQHWNKGQISIGFIIIDITVDK